MILRLLAGLFAVLSLAACEAPAPAPQTQQGTPALWLVENETGDTAGWLFGTIHALPDGANWETPAIADSISRADRLVVEVRDLDPALLSRTLRDLAHDCPCPPVYSRLPSGQRAALADIAAQSGMDTDSLDDLETWAVALALARGGGGLDAANGADTAIMKNFVDRPIEELEGAASQLAIFDRLPEAAQRAMLVDVIRARDEDPESAQQLAAAWLRGDLASLEAETMRGLGAHPALYRALFADRNERWMRRLIPLFSGSDRALVAVGTAHMMGRDGLVARLRQEGFTVRRIQ